MCAEDKIVVLYFSVWSADAVETAEQPSDLHHHDWGMPNYVLRFNVFHVFTERDIPTTRQGYYII